VILQAALVFNLVCSGTFTSGQMMRMASETRQVQVTFRVDLERGRWCSGTCETTVPLHSVSDSQIIFRQLGDILRPPTPESPSDTSDEITVVNRENGQMTDRERYWRGDSFHYRMTVGSCERAAFSGFPTRRF